jgi:hypothetical protein
MDEKKAIPEGIKTLKEDGLSSKCHFNELFLSSIL